MPCHSIYTWMVFTPVWVHSCVFRLEPTANALSQYLHLNGLTPVWVRSCVFSLEPTANALSQYLHLNGLTPVWILPCLFRLEPTPNALSQYLHLNGLTPVWVHSCVFRSRANCKCLVTVFTLEWFNTSMGTFMRLQIYRQLQMPCHSIYT